MAQKSSTVNYYIHDTNGQPQMIKVVQSASTKPMAQIKLGAGTMKTIFKVPGTPDVNQQGTVYKTVSIAGMKTGSKLVKIPVQSISQFQNTYAKPVETSSQPTGSYEKKVQQSNSEPNTEMGETDFTLAPTNPKQSAPATSNTGKTHISPQYLSNSSRKRLDSENDLPEYTSKRRRAADKVGKGLRHFSMKVCEKVRKKGFTSYNEVADELVAEFASGMHGSPHNQQYDQKNIRRRVYDALNVLMAMNIISKEKKEIRWLGLPTNSVQECSTLEREKERKLERIEQKTQQLHDLILQHISFKSLVERNREAESRGVRPQPSSAIHLPFIVVNTSDKAHIDCSISNDKREYMFHFNKKFQIYDDIDILKRMGLLLGLDKGECCSVENLEKAKSMVPKSLQFYVEQLARGTSFKMTDILGDTSSDMEDMEGEVEVEDDDEEEEEDDGPEDGGRASSDEDSSSELDVN